MNNRKELSIDELNDDALLHVFSFLTRKELKNNRFVSKKFKDISNASIKILIKQTASQIFYTVGDPVLISSPRSTSNKLISFMFGVGYDVLYINFRKNISNTEIRSSFPPTQEKIRLFKSEAEALAYSRYLRVIEDSNSNDGEKVYQPAIFKIQYLDRLDNIRNNSINLLINTHNENDYFDEPLNVDVEYFEVDKNIIPHLAILKIELGHKGEFKKYPPVEYKHPLQDQNSYKSGILPTFSWPTLSSYINFKK